MNVLKRKVQLYKKLSRVANAGFYAQAMEVAQARSKHDDVSSEFERIDRLHKSSKTEYSDLRQVHLSTEETRQLSDRYLSYLLNLVQEKRQILESSETELTTQVEKLKHERALKQAMVGKYSLTEKALYESYMYNESLDLMTIAAAKDVTNDRR